MNHKQVVEDKLITLLGDELAFTLANKLAETEAVIAGGFVLGSLLEFSSSDIDIYVHHDKYIPILSFLREHATHPLTNVASPYDKSFFKRNGILIRVSFRLNNVSVDLMITGRNVLDVCSNFDLTFCQLWYNPMIGVGGTHIELALDKKGYLNKEYLPSLLESNYFTVARMKKYTERGFLISLGECVLSVENFGCVCEHTYPDPEEFLRSKLLELLTLDIIPMLLKYPGLLTASLKDMAIMIAEHRYEDGAVWKTVVRDELGLFYNLINKKLSKGHQIPKFMQQVKEFFDVEAIFE